MHGEEMAGGRCLGAWIERGVESVESSRVESSRVESVESSQSVEGGERTSMVKALVLRCRPKPGRGSEIVKPKEAEAQCESRSRFEKQSLHCFVVLSHFHIFQNFLSAIGYIHT